MAKTTFLKTCFLVGALVDLVSVVPLLSPSVAQAMFGISPVADPVRQYVGDVAAALMLGWTVLLFWGSLRPIERRGVLLMTVAPVLVGLVYASIYAVQTGAVAIRFVAPLWVFYALVIPAYLLAFVHAGRLRQQRRP